MARPTRKNLTGRDNAFLLIDIALLLVGLYLIFEGLSSSLSHSTSNLLLGIGISLAGSSIIAGLQLAHAIATRHEPEANIKTQPPTVLTNGVKTDAGLDVIPRYSQLEVGSLIQKARREVLIFVVSGLNVLTPQVQEAIFGKLRNPQDKCKIRMLALDAQAAASLVRARIAMMNIDDVEQHISKYRAELRFTHTFARRVTKLDPTNSRFDIRFYSKLPTVFFLLIDDIMYVSFILSQPVAACPALRINTLRYPELAGAFVDHFEHYWATSKSCHDDRLDQ